MSEKITFKELVKSISGQTEQSESMANSFVHELVQIIETGLRESGTVRISGFGKFELRWRNERTGRNPQTGEVITIPGQNKVVFKPYKALRNQVNKPYADLQSHLLDESTDDHKQTSEKSSKDVKDPIPVASDEPVPEKKENSYSPFFSFSTMGISGNLDKSELAQKAQESGSRKWSYTAASVIAVLAVLVLLFVVFKPAPVNEQATAEVPEEQYITETENSPKLTESATEVAEEQDAPEAEEAATKSVSYQVSNGESLWTIAESKYGDPFLWPLIYQENIDKIENPNRIMPGSELSVPGLADTQNLTDEQTEKVALGYLSIYEWASTNLPEQAKYFLWAAGSFSPDLLEDVSGRIDSSDLAFAIQK